MKIREFEKDHVLVRCPEFKPSNRKWMAASYERQETSNGKTKYFCSGSWWLECISYQGNEELLGTTMKKKDWRDMKWGEPCTVWHDEHGWREAVFIQFDEEDYYHPWKVILKPSNKLEFDGKFQEYSASVLKLPSQEE
jgi:hypothetical protein